MIRQGGQDAPGKGPLAWLAKRYLKLLTAAVFLLIGTLYLQHTFTIRVPRIGDPLGPRAFPLILGAALVTLTLVFLAMTAFGRQEENDARDMAAQRRAWAAFGMMAGFVLLLPYTGYPVAVAIFALAFLTFFGFGTLLINVGIAAAMAVLFHLAFVEWLRLPLPRSW